MKVRQANALDGDAVLSLYLRFYEESRYRRYPLNMEKVHEAIEAGLQPPKSRCLLVAEHSTHGLVGLLAGSAAALWFSDTVVVQDHGFYVLPEFRGSTAALKLVIAFRRWAENRRAAELFINQSGDIDQARFGRFMRHMGFTCCGSNFVIPLGPSQP